MGGGYSKFGVRQATLLDMVQEAARACADDIPGLKPADIDVAQVHDCFTISEVIEVEELGFCKKGEGGAFVASGARQAVEICKQLQGRAQNQVKGAKFGLTHNLSGVCAQHTVIIYGTEPVK